MQKIRLSRAVLRMASATLVAVSLVASLSSVAIAQGVGIGGQPAHPDPQNARTKSIFVKTIKPGDVVSDEVQVMNGTAQAQNILVYATDSVVSSGGAFACAQASDVIKGAGSWIKLASSAVDVPANGSVRVPFTITVPNNAEAGEQDACIVLQQKKDTTIQSGIGLNFRTGIRVAILVPGNIVKTITPAGLSVEQKSDKLIVTPQVKNTGTVSVDAKLNTQIRSVFGTVAASQESVYPVLRGQTSQWNIEMNRPFWGGMYAAHYTVSYDKSNNFIGQAAKEQDITTVDGQTVYIFVFPALGAFIIELIAIVALAAGGFLVLRTLRQRNQVRHHWVDYRVEAEQLSDIAEHYRVSWKVLARVNNIKAPYRLTPGSTIKVPSDTPHVPTRTK